MPPNAEQNTFLFLHLRREQRVIRGEKIGVDNGGNYSNKRVKIRAQIRIWEKMSRDEAQDPRPYPLLPDHRTRRRGRRRLKNERERNKEKKTKGERLREKRKRQGEMTQTKTEGLVEKETEKLHKMMMIVKVQTMRRSIH